MQLPYIAPRKLRHYCTEFPIPEAQPQLRNLSMLMHKVRNLKEPG